MNAPANITTPTCLAEVALQTAATFSSRMTTTVRRAAWHRAAASRCVAALLPRAAARRAATECLYG